MNLPPPRRYRVVIIRHSDGYQERLSRQRVDFADGVARRHPRRGAGPAGELAVLDVQRPSAREWLLVGADESWRLTGCGCGG